MCQSAWCILLLWYMLMLIHLYFYLCLNIWLFIVSEHFYTVVLPFLIKHKMRVLLPPLYKLLLLWCKLLTVYDMTTMERKHNGCIKSKFNDFRLPLQLAWEQFTSLPASQVLKYEHTQVQLELYLLFTYWWTEAGGVHSQLNNEVSFSYQFRQSVNTVSPGLCCSPFTSQRQSDSRTHTPSWK